MADDLTAARGCLRLRVHPLELFEIDACQIRIVHNHQVLVVVLLGAVAEFVVHNVAVALLQHIHASCLRRLKWALCRITENCCCCDIRCRSDSFNKIVLRIPLMRYDSSH
jgi:hypothetical protein